MKFFKKKKERKRKLWLAATLLPLQLEVSEFARQGISCISDSLTQSASIAEECLANKGSAVKALQNGEKFIRAIEQDVGFPLDLASELLVDCLDDISSGDTETVRGRLSSTISYLERMLKELYPSISEEKGKGDDSVFRWSETQYKEAYCYALGAQQMCWALYSSCKLSDKSGLTRALGYFSYVTHLFRLTNFEDQCRQIGFNSAQIQLEISASVKRLSWGMVVVAALTLVASAASICATVALSG